MCGSPVCYGQRRGYGLLLAYRCVVHLCVTDREGGVGFCWGIDVLFTCVLWTEKVMWVIVGV